LRRPPYLLSLFPAYVAPLFLSGCELVPCPIWHPTAGLNECLLSTVYGPTLGAMMMLPSAAGQALRCACYARGVRVRVRVHVYTGRLEQGSAAVCTCLCAMCAPDTVSAPTPAEPACLLVCLSVDLPACLLTGLPACVLICLSVDVPVSLPCMYVPPVWCVGLSGCADLPWGRVCVRMCVLASGCMCVCVSATSSLSCRLAF
jgi:hypothetical protein